MRPCDESHFGVGLRTVGRVNGACFSAYARNLSACQIAEQLMRVWSLPAAAAALKQRHAALVDRRKVDRRSMYWPLHAGSRLILMCAEMMGEPVLARLQSARPGHHWHLNVKLTYV